MAGRLDPVSALKAGILGTVAMTILMYGLPPLMGSPAMDIMAALGSVFPFKISPYIFGFLVHFGIGIGLTFIYAAFFYSWLPGPGWLKGGLFSLLPWLFAITLLGPSLQVASRIFGAAGAGTANPCAVSNPCAPKAFNPCAPAANPCAVKPANPCAAGNPCAIKATANPCAAKSSNPCAVNPCAVKPSPNPCAAQAANPCAAGPAAGGGIPPQVLSLIVHLIYGGIVGAFYRPRA